MKTRKTNKVFKALNNLFLLAFLVLTMSNTVYAAVEPFTLTFENAGDGHTYTAYQIFSGKSSGEGEDAVLIDIAWGSGLTENAKTQLGDAAAKADTLKTFEDAKAFASTLVDSAYLNNATAVPATGPDGDGNYTISDLQAGYYLVKDELTAGTITYMMVQVVDDVTAQPKTEIASFEKKVQDINDSEDTETNAELVDSADYDIGDHVPFTLTAVLPEAGANGYGKFTAYYMAFSDDLADGLQFDEDSLAVYVDSVGGEEIASSNYVKIPNGPDLDDFTLVFPNLKNVGTIEGGEKIIVTYTATLLDTAVIGNAGNLNTASLTYLSDPSAYDGVMDYTAIPEEAKGTTTSDVVSVFTYELLVDKIDNTFVELGGAGFTLYKYDVDGDGTDVDPAYGDGFDKYFEVATLNSGTSFSFKGLDDGQYVLIETTTPEGYNSIDPIMFEITAEHSGEADTPAMTALTVASDSTFTASVDGTQDAIKQNGNTKDLTTGQIFTEVVNKAGATLPSTGGIGTTIFYVAGGALFVIAVVLLVAKKRANSQQMN